MSAHLPMPRFLVGLLALVTLAALVSAAPADAEMPKTKTKLIVLGKSVAGVKLGMPMNKAGKIWKLSEGTSCFDMNQDGILVCMFEVAPSGANYHTGNISYSGRKKVESIRLRMPLDGNKASANLKRPLLKYKTSKKKGSIGLNVTTAKLRSKLGSKLKLVYNDGPTVVYQYRGPKKAKTDFVISSGRVATIEMYSGKSRY